MSQNASSTTEEVVNQTGMIDESENHNEVNLNNQHIENDSEIKETIVDNTKDNEKDKLNDENNQLNVDVAEITEEINYNYVITDDSNLKDYKIGSYDQVLERGLVLNKQTVNSKEDLAKMIVTLMEYIVKMNNYLPTIKWSDIEFTVENDFLKTKFH